MVVCPAPIVRFCLPIHQAFWRYSHASLLPRLLSNDQEAP
jgi:hypothetical protein